PESWREAAPSRVAAATASPASVARLPTTFGDGVFVRYHPWDAGEGDPDDPLDRAVAATRREVLPLLGLDPTVDR
nr:hypothetical protein [Micromonospora sp. DSM 115978]